MTNSTSDDTKTPEFAAACKRVSEKDYIEAANELGVDIVDGPITPGDMYLAGRNTGMKLLTCESVDPKQWIVPTDSFAYSYNTWECKKVQEKV